jgi:methylated-DNA-[protein]-cysteine S-methyltransferase
MTAFQERVYELTRRIPRGHVSTYGVLARTLGCGSAQAVGQALRRNPFAPEVPCHRVVAADGTLHGFGGGRTADDLARKRRLLEREGVRFVGRSRVDPGCILRSL